MYNIFTNLLKLCIRLFSVNSIVCILTVIVFKYVCIVLVDIILVFECGLEEMDVLINRCEDVKVVVGLYVNGYRQ